MTTAKAIMFAMVAISIWTQSIFGFLSIIAVLGYFLVIAEVFDDDILGRRRPASIFGKIDKVVGIYIIGIYAYLLYLFMLKAF